MLGTVKGYLLAFWGVITALLAAAAAWYRHRADDEQARRKDAERQADRASEVLKGKREREKHLEIVREHADTELDEGRIDPVVLDPNILWRDRNKDH